MKFLKQFIATVMTLCVLSLSAWALPVLPDDQQQPPPPKKEKEIPKEPKREPPRENNNNNADRGNRDGKKGRP